MLAIAIMAAAAAAKCLAIHRLPKFAFQYDIPTEPPGKPPRPFPCDLHHDCDIRVLFFK
jgi:hypothetical protein